LKKDDFYNKNLELGQVITNGIYQVNKKNDPGKKYAIGKNI
jgi:hypothetical protein